MQQTEIKGRFEEKFNGQKNFMTPTVIRYGKRGKFLYELSKGSGFHGETMYGVTVLELDGTHRHDLCECFHNRGKADQHIALLSEEG